MSVLHFGPVYHSTRREYLQAQALYLIAQDLYRLDIMDPRAEIVDIHPEETKKYHAAAQAAHEMTQRRMRS